MSRAFLWSLAHAPLKIWAVAVGWAPFWAVLVMVMFFWLILTDNNLMRRIASLLRSGRCQSIWHALERKFDEGCEILMLGLMMFWTLGAGLGLIERRVFHQMLRSAQEEWARGEEPRALGWSSFALWAALMAQKERFSVWRKERGGCPSWVWDENWALWTGWVSWLLRRCNRSNKEDRDRLAGQEPWRAAALDCEKAIGLMAALSVGQRPWAAPQRAIERAIDATKDGWFAKTKESGNEAIGLIKAWSEEAQLGQAMGSSAAKRMPGARL